MSAAPVECVIGASQIAAIIGIDRFQTAEQLYRRMLGLEPWEPENEHMKRGKYLEPGLCAWWCDLAQAERREMYFSGRGVVLGNGQLQVWHPELPWARATADVVADAVPVGGDPHAKGRVLLAVDIKSPRSDGKKVGETWVKVWDEKAQLAPPQYVAQSTFQQGVLRAAGVPVVAGELAAGPVWGNLIRVAVPFDAEFFALMLERAAEFRECVLQRKPLPSHFMQQEEL